LTQKGEAGSGDLVNRTMSKFLGSAKISRGGVVQRSKNLDVKKELEGSHTHKTRPLAGFNAGQKGSQRRRKK